MFNISKDIKKTIYELFDSIYSNTQIKRYIDDIKEIIYDESIKNKNLKNKKERDEARKIFHEAILIKANEDRNKLRNEGYINEDKPIFLQSKETDSIRFFKKFDLSYTNIFDKKGLYTAIKDGSERLLEENNNNLPAGATVYYQLDINKVRFVNVTASELETFGDFDNKLASVESGDFVGSDEIEESEEKINYNHFGLYYYKIGGTGIDSTNILFYSKQIKADNKEKNNCANVCLREFGINTNINLINLDKLTNYIEDNKLNISILLNGFELKNTIKTISEKTKKDKLIIKDKRGNEKVIYVMKLSDDDIKLSYHLNNGEEKIIIYDDKKGHYDIIDGKPRLNNIMISNESKIIRNNEVLFNASDINKNANNKPDSIVKVEYLFFDYETIIDWMSKSIMKPYSLSILKLSEIELDNLVKADEKEDKEEINRIRKDCCITFTGLDCNNFFIDWLIENQKNKAFRFIGFNNSNFDNFILLNGLLNYRREINIDNIMYNGNSLLNFRIEKRHELFDIRRHLIGSLKNNCKSFNIKTCSKKELDHFKYQQLYDNGELFKYIDENKDELTTYNEYDVLSTAILYKKYKTALSNIKTTKILSNDLFDKKTIGGLIYECFKNKSKINYDNNKLKLDVKTYQDMLKYKVAGRVELFNGEQKIISKKIQSLDVCSLYPYIMAVCDVYFPCGEIKETETYIEDKIGFYYCDIDQSNLFKNNLPLIYPQKTKSENKYDSKKILKDYFINNVDIQQLKKYGCKVEIKNGIYFTEKIKNIEIFGFLLDIMKAKNEQDDMKNKKDINYNSSLRETMKLLMNSLSGKVIEGLHNEKVKDINSYFEFDKIQKKADKINTINSIGNKLFVSYELKDEDIIKKQRPVYLGCLIYSYARRHMYNYSYSLLGKDKCIYTDTDATKFLKQDGESYIEKINKIIVPHWKEVEQYDSRYKIHTLYNENSKVFGSFEDELEEMNNKDEESYYFYTVQKKCWLYGYQNNDEIKNKFRFKGVSQDSKMVNLDDDYIEKKENKKGDIKYIVKDENKAYIVYNNKNNSLDNANVNNVKKFFEDIYINKYSYILCQSFKKLVKNSKRDVKMNESERFNMNMNTIEIKTIIKKIVIENKNDDEDSEEDNI